MAARRQGFVPPDRLSLGTVPPMYVLRSGAILRHAAWCPGPVQLPEAFGRKPFSVPAPSSGREPLPAGGSGRVPPRHFRSLIQPPR